MEKFTIEDVFFIYKGYKKKYGQNAYRHISQVLADAKPKHKKAFSGNDHEQSWRAFKGKNLEKLIIYIISSEIKDLGLKIVDGNKLVYRSGNTLAI